MPGDSADGALSIRAFEWAHWPALWEIRLHQLAELGVVESGIPDRPDLSSPYERDYHRIDRVYLTGVGHFWIAWWDGTPVGHVGAQDVGGAVELRRMYVREEYRRREVGTRLVRALIAHCARRGVRAIELWTGPHGPGRLLYRKLGFREVERPGPAFTGKAIPCAYTPSPDEIRMRLDLPEAEAEPPEQDRI